MYDLRLKCTKFDFRWGSAPDTAYRAPPDLAVFKGGMGRGREGVERKAMGKGSGGNGRGGGGRKGRGGREGNE